MYTFNMHTYAHTCTYIYRHTILPECLHTYILTDTYIIYSWWVELAIWQINMIKSSQMFTSNSTFYHVYGVVLLHIPCLNNRYTILRGETSNILIYQSFSLFPLGLHIMIYKCTYVMMCTCICFWIVLEQFTTCLPGQTTFLYFFSLGKQVAHNMSPHTIHVVQPRAVFNVCWLSVCLSVGTSVHSPISYI